MQRIEALGKISDDPNCLTRTFCSPAMRRANAVVGSWMREAGMRVRSDALGNLIGHFPAVPLKSKIENRKSRTLLLGSHLDTVRNAGKLDGPLGVLIAVACVQHLQDSKTKLPFCIEVVGFADEEGVRYQSTYLGSKVLAGKFNLRDLKRLDRDGVSMIFIPCRGGVSHRPDEYSSPAQIKTGVEILTHTLAKLSSQE